MYSVAKTIQYPLLCPCCNRNTSTLAAELLEKKQLQCRHCPELMVLSENQLNSLRRTLTDLDSFMARPQAIPEEAQEEAGA